MNALRLIAARVVLGVVTIWVVITGVYVGVAATDDWTIAGQSFEDVYLEWMIGTFTLQWGTSFQTGAEVLPTVLWGGLRTLAYVLPALFVAAPLGFLIGLYTATRGDTVRGRLAKTGSYLGLAVPNFWIGAIVLIVAPGVAFAYTPAFLVGRGEWPPEIVPVAMPFLYEHLLPTLLVATTILAAVVSYARAYSMQYYADDLVKLVRAKGGGPVDVARHVMRNAALPFVSLLFAETFALVALSVFVVEAVFAIEGIGTLLYNAVWVRDLPVLLGTTTVIVAAGVVGTTLQDLLYSWLDPRVELGSR